METDSDSSFTDEERWHRITEAVCCWRDSQFEDGRCFLHSQSSDRSIQSIQEAINDPSQRIDGIVLDSVELFNELSLTISELKGADFSGGKFPGCVFDIDRILYADFSRTNLQGSTFSGSTVISTDFSGSNLRNADFQLEQSVIDTTFDGCDLQGANFEIGRRNIHSCSFTESNLVDSDMSEMSIGRGVLRQADLTDANLTMTYLSRADVRGANFENITGEGLTYGKQI